MVRLSNVPVPEQNVVGIGAGWVHRQVMGEEGTLAVQFDDEFGRYRAATPRYWL